MKYHPYKEALKFQTQRAINTRDRVCLAMGVRPSVLFDRTEMGGSFRRGELSRLRALVFERMREPQEDGVQLAGLEIAAACNTAHSTVFTALRALRDKREKETERPSLP